MDGTDRYVNRTIIGTLSLRIIGFKSDARYVDALFMPNYRLTMPSTSIIST